MAYGIDDNEVSFCLECGGEIVYGRSGRKFCSQQCKNLYHNRQHHYRRSVKLMVTGALEKNYEILERLLKADITSVSLGDLSQMGYNKEFMTSYHKISGHDECRCYDIKYYCTSTRIFNIQRVSLDY